MARFTMTCPYRDYRCEECVSRRAKWCDPSGKQAHFSKRWLPRRFRYELQNGVRMLVALAALLAAGCAKPGHFRPSNLTPLETEAASQAFETWCSARDGVNCAYLDPNGNATVELSSGLPQGAWGMYHAGLSKIVVRDARGTPGWLDVFRAIVLHEIGHYYYCLEEPRDYTGPSAMGDVPQAIEANGKVDLAALRSRGVCPKW